MRISDWSSDVCSSDLADIPLGFIGVALLARPFEKDRVFDLAGAQIARQMVTPHQLGQWHTQFEIDLRRAHFSCFIAPPVLTNRDIVEHGSARKFPLRIDIALESADRKSTRLNSSH